MLDSDSLLQDLTDPQKQAVTHVDGPLLVVAGAGSGKTRVITRRVAYLISQGIPPASILAITFTNKAAGEMKERISRLLGQKMYDFGKLDQRWPTVCTFHSLCLRILRHYAAMVGLAESFSIYDSGDQTRLIKDALKTLDISSTNFAPSAVHATISNAKNQLLSPAAFAASADNDFYLKNVARVYAKYQDMLKQNNALDFDDLLLRTADAFRNHPQVLQELQDRFQYILIDEYQDTNHAQYIIAHALAMKHRNMCVVGDPDQCLPPGTMVQTSNGPRAVESLRDGDRITSACGWGKTASMPVDRVMSKPFKGTLLRMQTADGTVLRGTPNHVAFAKLRADRSLHYTYLMWKRGVGYRIGTTRGVRVSKDGQIISGLQVRANQEVADAIWILHSGRSPAEARYHEHYYSVRYGIPTMVFFVRGRRMDITQPLIDRLYRQVDSQEGALRLMDDLCLDRRYPHHRPGAVTRKGAGADPSAVSRRHVLFTMFGDGRPLTRTAWCEHRIQLVTSDAELRSRAEGRFPVREGTRGTWRIETSRKDYDAGVAFAGQIASLDDEMDVVSRARLTPEKSFLMMPLSHIHPGMVVPMWRDGQIIESLVEEVTREEYEGPVYDLSVPNTRNYIAGGVVVHNSIYAWRGADIRNILDFEKDYPDTTVVRLEQNYRSTQTILKIASDLIARNSQRKDKRLWTENIEGVKAEVLLCQDEHHEAATIAQRLQRLHDEGKYPWSQMAVFYRINALSRVMEDALRRANIPYQIARGVEFYNRKEIKDVLAYLRVIANPADAVNLQRIVNVPPRGLGATTLKQLEAWGLSQGISLWEAFMRADDAPVTKRAAASARQFVQLVHSWQQLAVHPPIGGKGKIQSLMEDVVKRSGLDAMLRKIGDKELAELANVSELINSAAEFDRDNPDGSLVDYLAMVSLVSDADHLDGGEGSVTMMTLHAAKGLEFPVVAMIGLEEGILPHARARDSRNELEEERRLCFVGITRAQHRLIFSKAARRTIRGLTERTITSPFLAEMPADALAVEDLADYAAPFTPSLRDEPKTDFRIGQIVRHPTFGQGKITDLTPMGRQTRAIVQFNTAGRKTLILEYARLQPANG